MATPEPDSEPLRSLADRANFAVWNTDTLRLSDLDKDGKCAAVAESVMVLLDPKTRRPKPLPAAVAAQLRRFTSCKVKFGVLKGKLRYPDDFDAPLPDELLALFEGRAGK